MKKLFAKQFTLKQIILFFIKITIAGYSVFATNLIIEQHNSLKVANELNEWHKAKQDTLFHRLASIEMQYGVFKIIEHNVSTADEMLYKNPMKYLKSKVEDSYSLGGGE